MLLVDEKPKVLLVKESAGDGAKTLFALLLSKHELRSGWNKEDGGPQSAELKLEVSVLDFSTPYSLRPIRFTWGATYRCHGEPLVRLSNGFIVVDPSELRGCGVGRYLFNEVIQWVKQWPDAMVQPIMLAPRDAEDGNKERRNALYENAGLTFEYRENQGGGASRPMRVSELRTFTLMEMNADRAERQKRGQLVVKEVDDMFCSLVSERLAVEREMKTLEASRDHCRASMDEARKHPVIFAAKNLLMKWGDAIGVLALLLIFATIYYSY